MKHHQCTAEDLAEMQSMRTHGATLIEIAHKYGCSHYRVHRLLSGKAKRMNEVVQRRQWIETPTAARILSKPAPIIQHRIRSRQQTCGLQERHENLLMSEINNAATKWLIKKGLWTPYDEYIRNRKYV